MNQNAMNNGKPVNRPANAKVKAKQPVKGNSVFTENWVKIKSIRNGIITLPNKEMVTGVRIEPRNIFTLERYINRNLTARRHHIPRAKPVSVIVIVS